MYLGLDLGTSGLKALLIAEDQSVVGEASAPLTVQRPHAGWSEQRPADWVAATSNALDALASRHDLSAVRGIGLSGQMHGAVAVDAAGAVIRPAILWNDTRAADEAAAMDAAPGFRTISGNIVFPGFTAPKLAWMATHEPDAFARIDKILLPKDYLRFWLTGSAVSEMSDAAGTAWLDVGARDWSDALLTASGLVRSHMPDLVEGSAVSGHLRAELAQRWGLKGDVPVAGGGGDNAAAGIGVGAVAPGQGFVSLGTSGVLFVATNGFAPDPETAVHTFCHALPDTWHQMGVILAATDALNWFATLVGSDAAALTADLGPLSVPGKTQFLPYLGGERTPLNDAAVRGAFLGLEHATDRTAATRAVLEGVTYALCDCRNAIAATGSPIDSLVAVGGGSQSDYWLSALATALGMPIERAADGDFGAAFGAARLAMMAISGDTSLAAKPPIAQVFEPDAALTQAFADGHARYVQSATAIQSLT